MNTTLHYIERLGSGPFALRIQAPELAEGVRTPTHFLLLIDISESMSDDNKLEHVKQCARLLLNFLVPDDQLSLITFGDAASVILSRSRMDSPAAAAAAAAAIDSLHTDGCTNLSAALAAAMEVLSAPAPSTAKNALLLLTDGHANRGVHAAPALRDLANRLRAQHAGLSLSFVAYGTDHNAELLKGMAEDADGSYSIVEDIEGAALAMGESLGGAISCVAQNVVVEFPAGTSVLGGKTIGPEGRLTLGDVYAGTEILILGSLGSAASATEVRGVALPDLAPFRVLVPPGELLERRDIDIELTMLRYRCSALFKKLREAAGGSGNYATLSAELDAFEVALADGHYAEHPIAQMLKREVPSLRAALLELQAPRAHADLLQRLIQHEAYTELGRGTTQPIYFEGIEPDEEDDGDPIYPATLRMEETAADPLTPRPSLRVGSRPPPMRAATLSPMASVTQQRVASQMRLGATSGRLSLPRPSRPLGPQ